jgi:Zn-finger nucleic acid-binding protein
MYFLLTKVTPPAAPLRVADDSVLADARGLSPSLRDETWRAILDLMALRPDARPSSAAEAREALGLTPARPTSVSPPPAAAPSAPPPPRAPGKRCAVCDVLLRPRVTQGVEIDCCNDCGGIWLDRGELARLVEIGRTGEMARGGAVLPSRSAGFHGEARPEGSMRHVGGRGSAFDRSRERREAPPSTGLLRVWKLLEELFG